MSIQLELIEKKEFKKSNWDFYEDGIIRIRIKDNAEIELEDTIIEYNYIKNRPDYLPMRILVIPGKNSTASKEVRDYSNSEERRSIVNAQAYVVESLAHKIIVNFMKTFYKTPV
ncbi:MAG: hypothetical protein ACI857_003187, partial [Arenicella sp.]